MGWSNLLRSTWVRVKHSNLSWSMNVNEKLISDDLPPGCHEIRVSCILGIMKDVIWSTLDILLWIRIIKLLRLRLVSRNTYIRLVIKEIKVRNVLLINARTVDKFRLLLFGGYLLDIKTAFHRTEINSIKNFEDNWNELELLVIVR